MQVKNLTKPIQHTITFLCYRVSRLLEQQTQYVFPSIQFGCKAVSATLPSTQEASSNQQILPSLNILLWGHQYRNVTENSEVFELRQNYSVIMNVTEPLTFMPGIQTAIVPPSHLVIVVYVSIQATCTSLGCLFLAQGNLIWRSSERNLVL